MSELAGSIRRSLWAWLENHIPELGDFDEENE